jgi:hypothetical protein
MLHAYFKDLAVVRIYSTSAERDSDLKAGRIDAALDLLYRDSLIRTREPSRAVRLT